MLAPAESIAAAATASSLAAVSGRYEGDMTLPQAGRFQLDLRIDLDSALDNSPAMKRISGDLYQISKTILPGAPPRVSKTYIESWIVDEPLVEKSPDHLDVAGTVRFWTGTHAATAMAIRITSDSSQPVLAAVVTLTETGGARRVFTCRRTSACFRSLELQIDVCSSVNIPPLIPTYDTQWHNDRPVNLPQRMLTIESAYREAGVEVTTLPTHKIVDDSAPQFQSWTPAELHDAMETHFERYGGEWPNWALWGLMAGKFETPSVGGIMFDTAASFGGAGKGTEREGFAVFRNHSWFNNLVADQPQNQDQAWARRHFLYTWVHEAGHAFNFLHSWDKGRPDSLSWMNYDWKYEQRNGTDTFWKHFAFRFDDDELIHLRHGNRSSVIMGGDPWSSGSHLDAPNLAMAQSEGNSPLELSIRSKGYFDLMEPVLVELRLRNLLPDVPVLVEKRLAPEFGSVVIYIQTPDDSIVKYEPLMCALATSEPVTLAPAQGQEQGADRHSREIFLSYGSNGFYFDQPGEYRIRAVYQGSGDVLIPSNSHRIRIGAPVSHDANRLAQDYFSDAVGLGLYLQGSRSPYLQQGVNVLHEVADVFKDSTLGINVRMALAHGVAHPFYRIEYRADPKVNPQLKLAARAEPKEALKLTAPVLKTLRQQDDKNLNLAYGRLVRRRAEYHKAASSEGQARAELQTLQSDLSKRGVNPPVLRAYQDLAASLGDKRGGRGGSKSGTK